MTQNSPSKTTGERFSDRLNALSECTYLGCDADILPLDRPLLDLPTDSRPHPSLVTVEPGRVYEAVAEVQGEPDSRLHVGVGGLRAETK